MKYTVEYCKKNDVAIGCTTGEQVKQLAKMFGKYGERGLWYYHYDRNPFYCCNYYNYFRDTWNPAPYNYKNSVNITFEQFKEHVLKQKPMERKIIAYKLLKDLPDLKKGSLLYKIENNEVYFESEVELLGNVETDNVYPLKLIQEKTDWFEPVYEEEFKVGDYIVFTKHSNDVVKITNIRTDRFHDLWISHEPDSFTSGGFGYKPYKNEIRLATPEEIEEATTIKIGDYEAKFEDTRVSFNSVVYYFRELIILRDLMNRDQIKSLNVGCSGQYTIDLELINKILKKMQ
jgi:hypothetical protein